MAKNLMPEIAKILEIEIGEMFSVNYNGEIIGRCAIYEDGLCYLNEDGSKRPGFDDRLLGKIMRGAAEIIKLPWEPKEGDTYYCVNIFKKRIEAYQWIGFTGEYVLKSLGIVYRTREEAEAHFAKDCEKLTGKKLEE